MNIETRLKIILLEQKTSMGWKLFAKTNYASITLKSMNILYDWQIFIATISIILIDPLSNKQEQFV